MATKKNHYEPIENCTADKRGKSKSSPLQQQQRHMVVPLHRTSAGFHKKPCPDVVANAESFGSASEARPLVLGNSERNRMNMLFVPVPSDWFGKPWGELMTFDEALKALNSDEQKKAVALMKEIDMQLGIEAELSSGINSSPAGANVVIVHDIKTPVDSDKLRYFAAVKGRALLDESPHSRIV